MKEPKPYKRLLTYYLLKIFFPWAIISKQSVFLSYYMYGLSKIHMHRLMTGDIKDWSVVIISSDKLEEVSKLLHGNTGYKPPEEGQVISIKKKKLDVLEGGKE